jgi:hypothetical protein
MLGHDRGRPIARVAARGSAPERGQLRKQIGPDSTPDPTPLHIFASVDAVGSEWPHPGGPTTSLRWGAATGQAASALTLRG